MYGDSEYTDPPSQLYLDDYGSQRPPDHAEEYRDWPDHGPGAPEDWRVPPPPTRTRPSGAIGVGRSNRLPQIGRGPPPPAQYPNRSASFNTFAHRDVVHPRDQRSRSTNFLTIAEEHNADVRSHSYNYPVQHPYRSQGPPADHGPDLVAMLENLTVQNTALKAQLALATSEPVSAVTASSTSVRGQFASRGKSRKKSGSIANRNQQVSVPTAPRESDESDVDSDTPSPGTPAVYLRTKDCTTPELKAARRAIQTFVSKTLRDVCGVGSKDLWPDPTERRVNEITEEVYLTPVFASDVTDPRNQHIFTIVTERAYTDLQRRSNWPTAARKVNGRWDRDLLHDMAKIAFRNLKPGWKAQVDAEAKTRNNLKKRNDRRTQRRVNKAIQRRSAVPVYAEDENLDPAVVTELVFEEHMSDEVSEPDSDDDTYESTAAWKAEMAKSAGFINLSQAALDKLEILEVVTPDWRADKMSKMFHRLHQIYSDSQSKRDKNKIVFVRVRNTGRRCRRIPAVAPYNFGIADGWLEQARCDPENVPLLVGWGTFENPAGFEEVEVTGEDVHGGDPVENSNADGTNSTTGLADRDLNELLFLSDPHVAAAS